MKKTSMLEFLVIAAIFGLAFYSPSFSALREDSSGSGVRNDSGGVESQLDPEMSQEENQMEAEDSGLNQDSGEDMIPIDPKSKGASAKGKETSKKKKKRIFSGEEAFIAGPDWEFDGFVVGGQDQEVKSMFVVNDLVYLNVGLSHGFKAGERLGIYKRGARVRDPQSGRFLGYQVKRIATVEITNKIEDETSSVRVITSHMGIEIGDLARRDR